MSEITRRDLLKVLGASGIVLGGMSTDITGIDKLFAADERGHLKIEKDKSYYADDIKPGTIIDSGNYTNFPQLKDLLPEHQYLRLKKGATRSDLPPIHVVAYRKLSLSKEDQAWADKNVGVVKIDPKTHELVNYKAGRPFMNPQSGEEAVWNFSVFSWGDSLIFKNCTFTILDKLNRAKVVDLTIWHKTYMQRTTVPPIPEFPNNPEKILFTQTTVFRKPYDIAGLALLRTRYSAIYRPDDTWAYFPAIRRVRRFTGGDVQDPLVGSDVPYDDFGNFMQRIDFKNVYPVKVEEGKLLQYSHPKELAWDGHNVKISGRQYLFPAWEIRPTYKITIMIKDPNYMYGKRIVWVDKETCMSDYGEYYDQKGNLYRTWAVAGYKTEKGEHNWSGVETEDWINGSKTFMQMTTEGYCPPISDSILTKEGLAIVNR